MDAAALEQLIETLNSQQRRAPEVRVGTCVDTSPFSVILGNSPAVLEARHLASYSPTVFDKVLVLAWGNDICVLGEIT